MIRLASGSHIEAVRGESESCRNRCDRCMMGERKRQLTQQFIIFRRGPANPRANWRDVATMHSRVSANASAEPIGLLGKAASILLLCFAISMQAQEVSTLEDRATGILTQRCLSCHNSELKTAGLVLANRESALKGGKSGPALVPNRAETSLMVRKVLAGQMPPGDPLPKEDRETLRAWVEAGAPWKETLSMSKGAAQRQRANLDWWSLQPLSTANPPSPLNSPAGWSGPIDRFVFAKMQEKGLQPSPPADRRTLVRRATFDLLGLPPTPEQVEAFVSDKSPDAYEKLIDRLLASRHYGEQWGRHWLDVVRFGESHGYEPNHLRDKAWPYRDYIIESLNADKPFDRMVLEQLAGDQIAPDDPKIEVATGFLVAGVHDVVKIENIEGQLQQRANDLDDIVLTTGAAFLGLTVNCARCHDHKFDPILQADYYRMQAAFAGVQHAEREVATSEEKAKRSALEKPIQEALEAAKSRLQALKSQGEPLVNQSRSEIAKQYRPPVDSKVNEESFPPIAARFIRMTILAATQNQEPALDELEVWSHGRESVNVALSERGTKATARSTRTDGTNTSFYRVEYLNDGKTDETWISGERNAGQVTLELPDQQTVSRIVWSRDRLGANQERFLSRLPIQYLFEASRDGKEWQKIASSEDRLPYTEQDREEFFLMAVLSASEREEWQSLKQRKETLEKQLSSLAELPRAYIGQFKQPADPTCLLKRGNPMDKGEVMAPGGLSTLKPMLPAFQLEVDAPEGERRLALARWIVDERNALTARVLANRVWHYHFGKGLVGTPSDFGFNGDKPTHPELLDWLAGRLQTLSWRLKPFHRELMLSAAYRQSSGNSAAAAAIDGEARYLWRFPPRRLEAEAIRDSILAVSGKLDSRMGGPGFRLYTYRVDNVATYGYPEKFGAETYRRSVYHQTARSVKDDMLGPFDCPDATLPEPKRVVTTTALQALSLLNNPFMLDQARFFAERLVREAGDNDINRQVRRAFELTLGRPPTEVELTESAQLIRRHGLRIFCRTLLNTNEFVYLM